MLMLRSVKMVPIGTILTNRRRAAQRAADGEDAEIKVDEEPCAADLQHMDDPDSRYQRQSSSKAANLVGASGRAVAQAKRIVEQAPDLAEKVRDGSMAIDRADRIIRDREAERRRIDEAKREAEACGSWAVVAVAPITSLGNHRPRQGGLGAVRAGRRDSAVHNRPQGRCGLFDGGADRRNDEPNPTTSTLQRQLGGRNMTTSDEPTAAAVGDNRETTVIPDGARTEVAQLAYSDAVDYGGDELTERYTWAATWRCAVRLVLRAAVVAAAIGFGGLTWMHLDHTAARTSPHSAPPPPPVPQHPAPAGESSPPPPPAPAPTVTVTASPPPTVTVAAAPAAAPPGVLSSDPPAWTLSTDNNPALAQQVCAYMAASPRHHAGAAAMQVVQPTTGWDFDRAFDFAGKSVMESCPQYSNQ
jgi:hypothetical protein